MSVVDEIKQRLDIVEVVSAYVPLQKAGRNFRALCPFHSEKTPSFFVFPERQGWYCFGSCASGGDLFTFVMKKENIVFGEALRLLAERAGVVLSPEAQKEDAGKDKLRHINSEASSYYHHLLREAPEARVARDYLVKRGVSEKSIVDFQLGFSLNSWQGLYNHMTTLGHSNEDLLRAELAIRGEGGGSYDRFRGKLMFPIRDSRGHTVGFGARSLDGSLPKYVNSPQTEIFDKGSVLYGMDLAKAEIKRLGQVVIVEGYMDTIIAHQYGFSSAVASMGTSLGEGQVTLLKGITKEIILALDADAAGEQATLRSLEVVGRSLDQKVVPIPTWQGWIRYESVLDGELKVAVLPQGRDPDEIIRENPEEWKHGVAEAKPILDFVMDVVAGSLDLREPRGKSAAVEQLLPLFVSVADPVRRAHYLQRLARLVGVDERTLQSSAERVLRRGTKGRRQVITQKEPPTVASFLSTNPLEEYTLALLFQNPQLREAGEKLPVDHLGGSEHRELLSAWKQAPGIDSLKESLMGPLQGKLIYLLGKPLPPMSPEEAQRAFSDCILRLRENFLKGLKLKEEAIMAITTAEQDPEELDRLHQQVMDTNAQLKAVFQQRGQQNHSGR